MTHPIPIKELIEKLSNHDLLSESNHDLYLAIKENPLTGQHFHAIFEASVNRKIKDQVPKLFRFFFGDNGYTKMQEYKQHYIETHWTNNLTQTDFDNTLHSSLFEIFEKRELLEKHADNIPDKYLVDYLSQKPSILYPVKISDFPSNLFSILKNKINQPEFHSAMLKNFKQAYYPSYDKKCEKLIDNIFELVKYSGFDMCQKNDDNENLTTILLSKNKQSRLSMAYFSMFNKIKHNYDLHEELLFYINHSGIFNHNSLATLIKYTRPESFHKREQYKNKTESLAFIVCRAAVNRSLNLQSFEAPVMNMCRILNKEAFEIQEQITFSNTGEKVTMNLVDFLRFKLKKDAYLSNKVNLYFVQMEKDIMEKQISTTNNKSTNNLNRL